jgi:glycosyltransferase involved in cell wall biosynthesis
MEIQNAGYLTLEARKRFKGKFPSWIVTNWGSDIYLFGRLSEHEPKIREVLAWCDYYSCECQRDVHLAKAIGLSSEVLPVFPNTGGFDLMRVAQFRQPGPTSARRKIMLKGYQGWSGRALVGLRALERCSDLLKEYEAMIYLTSPDVMIAAELFQKSTGILVKIIPENTPHLEMLRFHGQARISIGLSIGDAISTSFLEALVMGSFPIQSWTSCADEWIEDGKNGILGPPEDPDIIEQAIHRALTDDDLVDRAAELNWKTAVERLDQSILKPKAVQIYTDVAKERGIV